MTAADYLCRGIAIGIILLAPYAAPVIWEMLP